MDTDFTGENCVLLVKLSVPTIRKTGRCRDDFYDPEEEGGGNHPRRHAGARRRRKKDQREGEDSCQVSSIGGGGGLAEVKVPRSKEERKKLRGSSSP